MSKIPLAGRTLSAALLVALLAAGCGPAEEAPDGPASVEATITTSASAEPLQILPVTADGLREEVRAMDAEAVVLNVWATWCGPCRVEFPEFVRYGRETDENVAVRFLSVDEADDLPRIEQFLAANQASGRTYLTDAGTGIVADLAAPFQWTYGIPVTIIFGPDGEVRDYWEGAVNYDFLEARVDRVLAGHGAPADGATTG